MARPYMLVPRLPQLPVTDWTIMHISLDANGEMQYSLSFEALPEITNTWHPIKVDILSLPRVIMHRSAVHQVTYRGHLAIAKNACFPWDFARMQTETQAYHVMEQFYTEYPSERRVAPEVLAQLTENGRAVGLLLQKLAGRAAEPQDLNKCAETLRAFQETGLVHGDVNKYNFVVDDLADRTYLLDFEYSVNGDNAEAQAEVDSLATELAETTGRGYGSPVELHKH